MYLLTRIILTLAILATAAVPAGAAVPAKESIVVAVVRDGAPAGEDIVPAIEAELARHLPSGTTVEFKARSSFGGDWDPARVQAAVEAALEDPETHILLVTGLMTTAAAGRMTPVKPVVSSFPQRADLFRLPYSEEDRSQGENLSFVVIPQRALQELETFRSLIPFETLHIALDPAELVAVEDLREQIAALEERLGATIEIAEIASDAGAFLSGVSQNVEALYVTQLPRLSESERSQLFEGLRERQIPSFSSVAHKDVDRGALMALSPDNSEQLVRRVALNLSRVIRGESTGDLPVFLTASTRLLINAETAVAIDYRPDRQTRMFAQFLHPDALEGRVESLVLGDAMRLAEEQNIALSIQDSLVESSEKDAAIARSVLLPQLYADVSHLETDAALGISSAGLVTDGATRGLVSLQQVIWDDRFRSNYKSAKRLAGSVAEDRESARLDVLADAGRAFFGLALAEALYEVQLDNLHLSQDNLELSRLREQVGYSGRDEVFRWEAVVADNRSLLFRSNQMVETTRIALNQILNVDQERRWRPEGIEVDPDVFHFLDGGLTSAFFQQGDRAGTHAVFTEIALENSPEASAVREVIAAQGMELKRARRAWFMPALYLGGSYATEIEEGDMAIAGFEDDVATFTLNFSYPIAQGGLKGSEIAKAEIDAEALQRELRLVEQLVEQRTRTALGQVENSFPRVRLSLQAADAAGKNLVIVQDKYAEGIVNVTDLLSAQTERFAAEQLAQAAVYEFLTDLVGLQRAIGWFEEEKSAAQKAALADRILAGPMAVDPMGAEE